MFGIFKNKARQHGIAAGVQIAAAFELLRREAPAAAYLFARTLFNARPLLEDESKSNDEKIRALNIEIKESSATSGTDAGVPGLAIRFLQSYFTLAEQDAISSYGYTMAYSDIVKYGERYRESEPRDRLPPDDEGSRAVLAKSGHACVGDLIDAVVAEREEKNLDFSEMDESIQTLLATFDMREEASSGRLLSGLKGLESACLHSTGRTD